MTSLHAIALFPLILSSIAHPLSPAPRDDPSTFLQDTDPLVENPSLSQDGDEVWGDDFAIPYYLYPSSSASGWPSSWPSPSSWNYPSSVNHGPSHSASASASASAIPVYTPWEPTPVANADKPTPVSFEYTTPTATPIVDSHRPTTGEEENPRPTFADKDENDSFDALWDILSGKIRNVLDSDEHTLWD